MQMLTQELTYSSNLFSLTFESKLKFAKPKTLSRKNQIQTRVTKSVFKIYFFLHRMKIN